MGVRRRSALRHGTGSAAVAAAGSASASAAVGEVNGSVIKNWVIGIMPLLALSLFAGAWYMLWSWRAHAIFGCVFGAVAVLMMRFRLLVARDGLLSMMPKSIADALLHSSILEVSQAWVHWLYAPTGVGELIKLFAIQMNQASIHETLEAMPEGMKRNVLTPGIINLMSSGTQRVLLPPDLRPRPGRSAQRLRIASLLPDEAKRRKSLSIFEPSLYDSPPVGPTATGSTRPSNMSLRENTRNRHSSKNNNSVGYGSRSRLSIAAADKAKDEEKKRRKKAAESGENGGGGSVGGVRGWARALVRKTIADHMAKSLFPSVPFEVNRGSLKLVGITSVGVAGVHLMLSPAARKWGKRWTHLAVDLALFVGATAAMASMVATHGYTRQPNLDRTAEVRQRLARAREERENDPSLVRKYWRALHVHPKLKLLASLLVCTAWVARLYTTRQYMIRRRESMRAMAGLLRAA